jgi:hypothetical protein
LSGDHLPMFPSLIGVNTKRHICFQDMANRIHLPDWKEDMFKNQSTENSPVNL